MKRLQLGRGFTLPTEAVTETIGILGVRGSGKTTTASVLAEELLKLKLPLCIIDPTDAWWGLRASKDGKSEGHAITILGGDHGDAPLEESAGRVIADLVAEEAPPLVLSLRLLSKSARRRFMTDFAERLYEKNRTALHLVIDEADLFAPQHIRKGEERLFGAIDEIVRRGRSSGIGVTLISQRSAAISKDVLSQASVLIAHRASHPRDLEPVLEWMKVHSKDRISEVHGSIAKLKDGEAWVMSPEWLDVFGRVQMRDRETFNSSATPKAGERRVEPRRLAPVDLDRLRERMAETIARAEADDPKRLRARITSLERDLAAAKAAPAPKVERVEVPAFSRGELGMLERLETSLREATAAVAGARSLVSAAPPVVRAPVTRQVPPSAPRERATAPPARSARAAAGPGDASLGRAERALLAVLAQRQPKAATKAQLSVLSGYSGTSSSFANALGALRSSGFVEGRADDNRITDAGLTALGSYDAPPSGEALVAWWMGKLGRAERALLQVVLDAHPQAVSREALSERSGYSLTSSSFANALGKLRTLELVTARGDVRASEELLG